jgi:predicted TIM-barrel fold metal-dependent hydrolase
MIVDYGATPPLPELRLPNRAHLDNYRRVYAASEGAVGGGEEDGGFDGYTEACDAAGIGLTVLKGRNVETTFGGSVPNEKIAAVCRNYPGRFVGFAAVDPNQGMTAVRELETAVREFGLRGLNLQCFEHRLAVDDRRMYPLYAKCVELNIPVNVHVGVNFSLKSSPDYGRPEMLDRVLCDFPELRACAAPPGWPWVMDLLSVAWRHPNLWIGLIAVRPRLLTVENSGYGPLLQYGRTLLKDRIIWGSAYPMMPIQRTLDEVRALPLEREVADRWLGGNAREFLRL